MQPAERVLPAMIPVSIEGQVLWAYLDTGSGRNFISREAVKMLKLKPTRHETREILTVNGTKVQSMPIFDTRIESLDGKSCEEIEYTVAYTRQEVLYDVYRRIPDIYLILGDSIYSRIRTERVFKGKPGEPLLEETTFGWVVHGGDEYGNGSNCM